MTARIFIASALAFGMLASTGPLAVVPAQAQSSQSETQSLRISNGSFSQTLSVPMNRAVVVDSDAPFAELSIANPGIADISTLSDRSIYVLGKAPGRTTLTILGANGNLIANIEVQVTPDVAEFRERLRQILPGEPIEVRTANDGVVLSGTVSSINRLNAALELAERYAPGRVSNLMSVGGTQQVMLRVRFSEVQRNVARNLSSSLAMGSANPMGSLLGSGGFSSVDSARDALGGTISPSTTQRAGVISGALGIGGVQFQVMLEALETSGLARTLSEPSLIALSGQEADFLAGGEFPVPTLNDRGQVTIEYRPFGVELTFTPRVLEGDVINLIMQASVSSIDPTTVAATGAGVQIPAFRRRQTSTTVELRDGESFAIAGLLQDDFRASTRGVPWLSEIPILGALFRSAEYQNDQSELIIFVTAHLVSPTRGEALMLPTDRVRLPNESELFLYGRVEGQSGPAAEVSRQDFRGSYGYVMD
ncbi:MAG: type II and III secretion system protein family protein [Pararhodobacter sp.]|nr:type II and III secretion system protein family protein [Pararhodobacter sp.]